MNDGGPYTLRRDRARAILSKCAASIARIRTPQGRTVGSEAAFGLGDPGRAASVSVCSFHADEV